MSIQEIFTFLLKIAEQSNDPEGVVSACLVDGDKILVSSPSSDDSIFHAEYLVLKLAKQQSITITPQMVLYTTLEPCSDIPNINDGRDCATCIIESGVKNVVYAAPDPEFSVLAKDRFESAGIKCTQIDNQDIIEKCRDLFNSTIRKDLSEMILARDKKL